MKIVGEEQERVTHFKFLETSIEEECCVEAEITVRMGPGWIHWKKRMGYCAQKDGYKTDETSNDIWGRNVGYNEVTRKWDSGKRDENAKVDVRSHTQRQDLERTLTRDNERGTGFQEDHWKNV